MSAGMIETRGSNIVVEGPLFSPRADVTLRRNLYAAVEAITEAGVPLVQAGFAAGIQNPTGQTVDMIEPHVYYRYDFRGGQVGSLWGRVRMKGMGKGERPILRREPYGTPAYPAERQPYIIASVLESGVYKRLTGTETSLTIAPGKKARVRHRQRTMVVKRRHALWAFRHGTKQLQSRAGRVAEAINLVKGLT